MSERKGLLKNFRFFLLLAVVATVIYLIARNLSAFGNVLRVVIGFGAMILVHELGHFIVAKLSGIKVEAFSLGLPPTFVGILRTENGYRVRVLPGFYRTDESDESDGSLLTFTVGKKARPGETEYRIGLIPLGGYNKILGQEDTKAVEASDDPRSFANKPVGVRMAVIAAGVFFNAVSAILIFMVVFLVGIKLMPPVVGGVVPGSPAARAGLKGGDEIIEIAGKRGNLDFSAISIAAALSGRKESVTLNVRRASSVQEAVAIVPEWLAGGTMRGFGILPPRTLTIARLSKADADDLQAKTGLLPGDRVISVNGNNVDTHWELAEIVRNILGPTVTVLAERTDPVSKEVERVESQIRLDISSAKGQVESEADLCHIYSIVPRLRITAVVPVSGKSGVRSRLGRIKSKLLALLGKKSKKAKGTGTGGGLERGDIILAIGDVENPTYKEFREVTTEYEKKELPIEVLRVGADGTEESLTVTVVPKRSKDGKRVLIGIFLPSFDAEHPVVAKTITVDGGPAKLGIPRGASITAVDGTPVSDFHDIIREIRRYDGERISIDWRIDEQVAGGVALHVDNSKDFISVEGAFAAPVPFEYLERLYRASGPIDAIVIGCRKAVTIVVQTYVSLKRLISGLVGQEELSGPFGIMAISYKIAAQRPLVEYVHFFGVISVLLAVFNICIPVAPLDGGWLVLLLVEKIKGSALSERAQEAVAYVGVTFILALLVYLTYNDILNIFFR